MRGHACVPLRMCVPAQAHASDAFKRALESYRILSSPEQRERYDRLRRLFGLHLVPRAAAADGGKKGRGGGGGGGGGSVDQAVGGRVLSADEERALQALQVGSPPSHRCSSSSIRRLPAAPHCGMLLLDLY